jgi:hypothetical protein
MLLKHQLDIVLYLPIKDRLRTSVDLLPQRVFQLWTHIAARISALWL